MDTQSNLDRLTDCKNTLKWAIVQASHEEVEPEEVQVPDSLEECERRLIEIVKKYTRDQKFENEHSLIPVYFAGWLGPYEGAFEYLVEHGLAKWCYKDWEQMITLVEEGE